MKGDAFYVSVKDNQRALIHPSSTALNGNGEWCIFDEVVLTSATYLRTVTFIKGEWYVVNSLSLSPLFFYTFDLKVGGNRATLLCSA